ncbi:hypothetical protein BCR33DRAFT_504026 [Rhizoclosmatium globosum]|uniref:Uncharacterized protein n=1 Tax=Rhizoclosmatium globosum TaxID=329046 RepID=A0A1Y2BK47_9FUNG|nr:hypothetical protein BCR33DRAFT_504026 [Rhizoclosmatium globosum]|eukprot:ORY35152.1 hypothetical protein BCR33DRAFT_504026 [Rhizoclosmatium globosum]
MSILESDCLANEPYGAESIHMHTKPINHCIHQINSLNIKYFNSEFVSGEPAEVVVGVTNLAPHPTAVFAISGYFAQAKNTSKPIHELDAQRFNIRLDSKQQASFPLRFTPEMEAQDLILVVLIDFFDAVRLLSFQHQLPILINHSS